jgi:hypothetical protein
VTPTVPASGLTPRFAISAWLAGDVGTLPGVGAGVGGAAAVTLRAFRLELGVLGLPSRKASLEGDPSRGGEVNLVAGTAGACYQVIPRGPFELSPCLGYEVGALHASGFGVTSPGEGTALWSALRPGILLAWVPLARLAVVGRVEAAVPFLRRDFVLDPNLGSVFTPGPVAGRLGLGLELRL